MDHSKTLREQGIEESETLLLRRKFFFSDTNVDTRDPVQLNLLYVQCRDGQSSEYLWWWVMAVITEGMDTMQVC